MAVSQCSEELLYGIANTLSYAKFNSAKFENCEYLIITPSFLNYLWSREWGRSFLFSLHLPILSPFPLRGILRLPFRRGRKETSEGDWCKKGHTSKSSVDIFPQTLTHDLAIPFSLSFSLPVHHGSRTQRKSTTCHHITLYTLLLYLWYPTTSVAYLPLLQLA